MTTKAESGWQFSKRVAALPSEEREAELDRRFDLLVELYPDAADFLGFVPPKSGSDVLLTT